MFSRSDMAEKTFAFKSGGYGVSTSSLRLIKCKKYFGNHSLVPPCSAFACVLGMFYHEIPSWDGETVVKLPRV